MGIMSVTAYLVAHFKRAGGSLVYERSSVYTECAAGLTGGLGFVMLDVFRATARTYAEAEAKVLEAVEDHPYLHEFLPSAGACGSFCFQQGRMLPASQWARPGKPEWRHRVYVRVDRSEALRLVEELARTIRLTAHDPSPLLSFDLHGELEPLEDGR